MSDSPAKNINRRTGHALWEFAYAAFLRLLALFFVIFAIQIWMQAIGIYSDSHIRFDTMPSHWRLVIAVLGILHPVTSLGLWGLFSWGIAVWLIDILVLLTINIVFWELFGFDQIQVFFHSICFVIFVILQLALRFTVNKS